MDVEPLVRDYLIDRMDLSIYEQNYNNDEKGAAAYQPKVLLKAVLHCYSMGILSSRKIEQACKSNIIVKALADGAEPVFYRTPIMQP